MKQLWMTLLAIFAPLGSLARVLAVILDWMAGFEARLADPEINRAFQTLDGRRALAGNIAQGEHWVNLLIGARCAELIGQRHTARFHTDWSGWEPHVPDSFDILMQRYQRLRLSFATIERDARHRAARIRHESAACPLRLAPSAQSTSPALCAVEASDHHVASTSATHWGRWHARPCTHDGLARRSAAKAAGGSHARGPPLTSIDCRLPIASRALPARSRPHVPRTLPS
jgi:hypothetical protein